MNNILKISCFMLLALGMAACLVGCMTAGAVKAGREANPLWTTRGEDLDGDGIYEYYVYVEKATGEDVIDPETERPMIVPGTREGQDGAEQADNGLAWLLGGLAGMGLGGGGLAAAVKAIKPIQRANQAATWGVNLIKSLQDMRNDKRLTQAEADRFTQLMMEAQANYDGLREAIDAQKAELKRTGEMQSAIVRTEASPAQAVN